MVCNLCCNRLACDIALTSPELLLKTFVNTVGRHGHKWRIILIEFISKTYSANLIPVVPTANIRFILFNLHWSARDALSFFILKNKYKSIRVSIPINIKKKTSENNILYKLKAHTPFVDAPCSVKTLFDRSKRWGYAFVLVGYFVAVGGGAFEFLSVKLLVNTVNTKKTV